ncbi:MAG TPA: TRAM domain-containing protein, partial [Thermoanaerobaculia bacterium]|nr:TRAM domain-containing protein [Thermoanaerobaculia bacterium]
MGGAGRLQEPASSRGAGRPGGRPPREGTNADRPRDGERRGTPPPRSRGTTAPGGPRDHAAGGGGDPRAPRGDERRPAGRPGERRFERHDRPRAPGARPPRHPAPSSADRPAPPGRGGRAASGRGAEGPSRPRHAAADRPRRADRPPADRASATTLPAAGPDLAAVTLPPPPAPVLPAIAARLAAWEEIEVEVEKLVAGGDGLARPEGVPVFVPRSAPGDRLRVRLVERRPDYGRAEIVEVLAPGPGRRRPPCPYYERCGGCQLQHLDDDLQSRLKAEATLETLARLGGIELPEPPEVLTAGHWSYRLRTQLHTRRRDAGPGGASPGAGSPGVEIGYFARGSNDLVPIEACPILVPELEALLPVLPERLADKTPRRLDLAAGGAAGAGLTRAA